MNPSQGYLSVYRKLNFDEAESLDSNPLLFNNELPDLMPLDNPFAVDETPAYRGSESAYYLFWNLAREMQEYGNGLIDVLTATIGIEFVDYHTESARLKMALSEEKIEVISNIMKWVCLLSLGYMPHVKDSRSVKKHLGIDYFIEVLIPSAMPIRGENHWSIEKLFEFVDNPSKFVENGELRDHIFYSIASQIVEIALTEHLINDIKLYWIPGMDHEFEKMLADIFDQMEISTRIRWGLFISLASYHLDSGDEGMTARPGLWPSSIPKELLPLLEKMDQSIRRKKTPLSTRAFNTSLISHSQLSMVLPTVQKPFINTALKSQVPELSNWMPNGFNSCYISSSLWGLFYLADHQVKEKILKFQTSDQESSDPPELRTAKSQFKELYSRLSMRELTHISIEEVNKFRRAMQQAFPWTFFSPNMNSQEDAFEFLSIVMTSLLELDVCAKDAPKFVKQHNFTRVDDLPLANPQDYDYAEALKPVTSTEPLPLIDIRLDTETLAMQTLQTLVTGVRSTEVLERNAYKRTLTIEGPKYYSVLTNHTEQLMVESKENAPEYFIGRIARFSFDHVKGIRDKLFHLVYPDATLDFFVRGSDGHTVSYDLAAITVHIGPTVESGHYFTYVRKLVAGEWKLYKFDDIEGIEECTNMERVSPVIVANGYILFYKKRAEGDLPPPPLFKELKQPQAVQNSANITEKKRKLSQNGSDPDSLNVKGKSSCIAEGSQQQMNFKEAEEWVTRHISDGYELDKAGFSSLEDLFHALFKFNINLKLERANLAAAAQTLERTIYVIDPIRDKDLQVLEDRFPIPGDKNIFGEEFMQEALYLYRQEDGGWILIKKKSYP